MTSGTTMATGFLAACVGAGVLLSIGCSAAARHKALTDLFDGVPPLQSTDRTQGQPAASAKGAPARPFTGSEHGPYAAKLCNGCHESGLTNALVAPKDELCFRCHTFRMDTKFTHGPLASGGCLICHDPHSSRYPHLLLSDSGEFCLGCHDREVVAKIEGHGGTIGNCTECHDAHGSDTKYLLK